MNERDICINNHQGNPDSVAANEGVRPTKATLRRQIMRYLRRTGDATCEQAELALAMKHQTCSARFSELKADGYIVQTGERRVTSSGRSTAAVYRVSDLARAAGWCE